GVSRSRGPGVRSTPGPSAPILTAAIAEDIGRQLVTAGDRFKPDHIEIEKVDFKAALATSQHLWDANIAIDVAWSVLPPPLLLSFTQADVDSLTLSAPTGHNNITLIGERK
ncbi:hypothetical protein A4X06_0g3488, partial [Tilletia controversa]